MSKSRRNVTSEDLKKEVLEKIDQYKESGFSEAGRIHDIIMKANPDLCPRLWYGMPGYAKTKDSAVICFFRKDNLISFGVTEAAGEDALFSDKAITPSAWYIKELDIRAEKLISDIVTKVS